ncbi:MAG TPA: isochorismatase family cysteine hydrolase [Devosia sp.]|nr:isochorismatase family cysteine hydrolase [Devosia sp.]
MLRFGGLGPGAVHLCVDMQRMFAEDTEWRTPWMERVLPNVVRLVERRPERTIFTRFIPAAEPGRGAGTWRRYYERWASMTRERLGADMLDLVAPLARHVPPALVVDKPIYSPWFGPGLQAALMALRPDALVISGLETEVCVLATVLGAIDHGYRTVIATDAICSSADSTHDAMLEIYGGRFGMQVETAATDELLDALA